MAKSDGCIPNTSWAAAWFAARTRLVMLLPPGMLLLPGVMLLLPSTDDSDLSDSEGEEAVNGCTGVGSFDATVGTGLTKSPAIAAGGIERKVKGA
ncbi:hypothetical protein V8C86DRAFT_2457878 [Haematococcus lacustris]